MTPENFTYWLQGFFELTNTNELTEDQVKMIKQHLALVFKNESASINVEETKVKKISLDDIMDKSKSKRVKVTQEILKNNEDKAICQNIRPISKSALLDRFKYNRDSERHNRDRSHSNNLLC